MIILTVRTDQPEAELSLFDDEKKVADVTWHAHRKLAETIHHQIADLLKRENRAPHDLGGIVAFQGPGSFTGLRIGLSVANALADSLRVPIVASRADDWQARGIERLRAGEDDRLVLPEYGAPVHITAQKK